MTLFDARGTALSTRHRASADAYDQALDLFNSFRADPLAGMLLMVPALVLFLIALAIFFIQQGMSPVAAHLLSGVIAAAASAALIFAGLSRLKPSSLTPDTTIRQVQKDIAAAKEMAR